MPETDERTVVRDARVDQIGFVDELVKQYSNNLKTDVKLALDKKEADAAAGDYFDAVYTEPGETQTIEPAKFFAMCKRRNLTEKEMLGCVKSIDRKAAEELFNGRDLDAVSKMAPTARQLRVTRKKGVELKLTDYVNGLAAAIKE